MKLVFDTNIWLRYFTKDDDQAYEAVIFLLQAIHEGRIIPAISTIILIEIIFILKSFYKLSPIQITQCVEEILKLRSMVLIEKTHFPEAFLLSKRHHQKISDCLIATQLPVGYKLCSFDEDLVKLVGTQSFISPKSAIEVL